MCCVCGLTCHKSRARKMWTTSTVRNPLSFSLIFWRRDMQGLEPRSKLQLDKSVFRKALNGLQRRNKVWNIFQLVQKKNPVICDAAECYKHEIKWWDGISPMQWAVGVNMRLWTGLTCQLPWPCSCLRCPEDHQSNKQSDYYYLHSVFSQLSYHFLSSSYNFFLTALTSLVFFLSKISFCPLIFHV